MPSVLFRAKEESKNMRQTTVDSFEEAAEAFYAATGNLMPGKDGCQRDENGDLTTEVAHDFKIWCAAIAYIKKSEAR